MSSPGRTKADHDALVSVPDKFKPSTYWFAKWQSWIDWSSPVDDEGNFIGSCPLHDAGKSEESAVFNFFKGVMRCGGDPSCHEGKRAMSMRNVLARMDSE
jgi:hypothetical protein